MNTRAYKMNIILFFVLFFCLLLIGGCYSNYSHNFDYKHTFFELKNNTCFKKKVSILPAQIVNAQLEEINLNYFSKLDLSNYISYKCKDVILVNNTNNDPNFLISPINNWDYSELIKYGRKYGLAVIVLQHIQDISIYNKNKKFLWLEKNKDFLKVKVTVTALDVLTGAILCKHTEDFKRRIKNETSIPLSYKNPTVLCLNKILPEISYSLGKVVAKAISKQQWATTFVSVDGKRAKIPVGNDVGICSGDNFYVFHVKHTIYDPNKNAYLLPDQNIAGKFIVFDVYNNHSYGIFEGSESPIIGDIIVP